MTLEPHERPSKTGLISVSQARSWESGQKNTGPRPKTIAVTENWVSSLESLAFKSGGLSAPELEQWDRKGALNLVQRLLGLLVEQGAGLLLVVTSSREGKSSHCRYALRG